MNTDITPSSKSHNVDIEAQIQSRGRGEISRSSSLASRRSTSNSNPSKHREERSRVASPDESGNQNVTETPHSAHRIDIPSPHETLQPTDTTTQSEWKPWKANDPLLTKIPKSETTMEDWVKAMEASDDGMCKGWRDQIDTLIIFAGLFSATVTAFTVESYQWLEETPADTLARLQLRNLLNATHDPAMDRLAPATFNVSPASVTINTLWFASLTLSLAAVVISILCKQWLYEYQRYDNFTTKEAFLIHGLRHRGLQAWRVPEIIASLPILLQTALVLFLIGILVLLWPLQTVVGSITTTIVGLTFLFLGITTALPSVQYIFPHFNTQCAYKSSQSWSFFFISAFWIFDFGEFTGWASFDQWEVTHVYNDMGSTLSRVYKLLCNNDDAVLSIYSVLADTSLKPTINADLALVPDFMGQLDPSQRPFIWTVPDPINPTFTYEGSYKLRRLDQIKGWLSCFHNPFKFRHRIKPRSEIYYWGFCTTRQIQDNIDGIYHLRIQSTLSAFLKSTRLISHPDLFNRFVEHWARGIDVVQGGKTYTPPDVYSADIQYNPDIAMYLVGIQRHLMKTDRFFSLNVGLLITEAYRRLIESYRQHEFNPPPVTLLKDIQAWINSMPESNLYRKASCAGAVLFAMGREEDFLRRFSECHTTDLEKEYLVSFARFLVTLFEREDILAAQGPYEHNHLTLAFLRTYLDQNPGPTESCST